MTPWPAEHSFSRLIYVANTVWALSPHDAQAFGIARRQPRLAGVAYAEPAEPGLRYGDLLRHMLAPGAAGDAWIRWDGPAWNSSEQAQSTDVISRLEARVRQVWGRAWRWDLSGDDSDPLAALRHRVYVGGDRLGALVGAGEEYPPKGHALLDVRFFYRLSQLRCHVSTSIWSAPPRDGEHGPPDLVSDETTTTNADVAEYHEAFTGLAVQLRNLYGDYLCCSGFHVFNLPVFWIVVDSAERVPKKPTRHLKPDRHSRELCRQLLDRDARDRTVSVGVLNGDLLIMRRMVQVAEPLQPRSSAMLVGDDVPTYLIRPAGSDVVDRQARAVVERQTAKVITDLTDLEADIQHQFYELQADLQIWRNHLVVYNAVVERGLFLWDALSTHLLIKRDQSLATTHRAIEVVHQILLQAVADLSHISTLISKCVADIADSAESVSDRYDRELSEWQVRRVTGIRPSLTTTGLVERLTEYGADTSAEANRVIDAYRSQLEAIAHAFDERRARELDGIQKAQFIIAIGAALIGLVAIGEWTIPLDENKRNWEWTAPVAWSVGLVIVVVIGYLVWRTRRVGRLGTSKFRQLYKGGRRARRLSLPDGLLAFLAETSTDALEQAADEDPSFADVESWRQRDVRLANWLAGLWDAGTDLVHGAGERGRRDLPSLSRQSEQWAAHTLILTERVRRMYLYPLPTLTMLYHCLTKVRNSFVGHLSRPEINAVATIDFDRSMARLGFGPDEASAIGAWLNQEYRSAGEALRRIEQLGLALGMTEEERARALAVIGPAATCQTRVGRPIAESTAMATNRAAR